MKRINSGPYGKKQQPTRRISSQNQRRLTQMWFNHASQVRGRGTVVHTVDYPINSNQSRGMPPTSFNRPPSNVISPTTGRVTIIDKDFSLTSSPSSVSNGTTTQVLYSPSLTVVPISGTQGIFNYADFSALATQFDEFRISYMTFQFVPSFSGLTDVIPTTAANNVAPLIVVVDFTDNATPSSYQALQGYAFQDKILVNNLTRSFEISYIPTVQNLVTSVGGFITTGSILKFPWIASSSQTTTTSIPITGFKMGSFPVLTNQVVGTTTMFWTVNVRVRTQWRKSK